MKICNLKRRNSLRTISCIGILAFLYQLSALSIIKNAYADYMSYDYNDWGSDTNSYDTYDSYGSNTYTPYNYEPPTDTQPDISQPNAEPPNYVVDWNQQSTHAPAADFVGPAVPYDYKIGTLPTTNFDNQADWRTPAPPYMNPPQNYNWQAKYNPRTQLPTHTPSIASGDFFNSGKAPTEFNIPSVQPYDWKTTIGPVAKISEQFALNVAKSMFLKVILPFLIIYFGTEFYLNTRKARESKEKKSLPKE